MARKRKLMGKGTGKPIPKSEIRQQKAVFT